MESCPFKKGQNLPRPNLPKAILGLFLSFFGLAWFLHIAYVMPRHLARVVMRAVDPGICGKVPIDRLECPEDMRRRSETLKR